MISLKQEGMTIMNKTICDLCGKDAKEQEYIIPLVVPVRAGRGNALAGYLSSNVPSKVNLCADCIDKFSNLAFKICMIENKDVE